MAVFHFCAYIEVGESCVDPLKYYQNNVCATVTLLQAMQRHKISYFVFSSTAALFGLPEKIPIGESDLTIPKNPYGETKLAVEKILMW
jgi:UDP-glucose 4-epimerase